MQSNPRIILGTLWFKWILWPRVSLKNLNQNLWIKILLQRKKLKSKQNLKNRQLKRLDMNCWSQLWSIKQLCKLVWFNRAKLNILKKFGMKKKVINWEKWYNRMLWKLLLAVLIKKDILVKLRNKLIQIITELV